MDLTIITKRLESFGYSVTGSDDDLIDFCISKVEQHIKNFCNIPAVPDELQEVAVDMVCGELLNMKFLTGSLDDLSGLNLEVRGVKTITEGDTTVQFADTDPSDAAKFTSLINDLIHGREGDLICFRRMRW